MVLLAGLSAPPPASAQESTQTLNISDEAYRQVVEHLLTKTLPPQLDVLADQTEALSKGMDQFCQSPDKAGLEKMRGLYNTAMDAWQEVQPWRMGPVMANGRDQNIEYWPDKHGTAVRQWRLMLKTRPKIYTNRDRIGDVSAAMQGFPALEEVLYNPRITKHLVVKGDKQGTYFCQFGEAVSGNLVTLTAGIKKDWPAFAKAMSNAGPDSLDYPSAKAAAMEIYSALDEGLLIIISQKLAKPMGEGLKDTHPHLAESWRAERSNRNIYHNLKSLFAIYDGVLNGHGESGKGMVALTANSGALQDKSFRLNWDNILKFAKAMPPSMVELLKTEKGYQKIQELQGQVAYGISLVENDIGTPTGLGGGFNALDGD
jgi:predicted lipoprotein